MSALLPRPSPDVVLRTIADETFVLPVRGQLARTTDIFVLSEVGRFVWELADGTRDLAAIARLVAREFEVSEEQAHTDVEHFVNQLRDYGLVEVIG